MRKRITNYDNKYDILYISKNNNKPAVSKEIIDGVLLRRDKDNKIVGVTIFDVKEAITSDRD
ncbi:MAG: DUF2283 domain-containing protein [Ignavibacteria bacterium]|nr:DUF2283 domain-containing protein [Ignavibacteria bacterium]